MTLIVFDICQNMVFDRGANNYKRVPFLNPTF